MSTHEVVYTAEEREVLIAFGRCPNMCIHRLHDLTGYSYPQLLAVCNKLQRRGRIFRNSNVALGKDDQYWSLREQSLELKPDQFKDERLSPLIGLTEQDMLNRVVMLKRMKRLLIVDWHPIIDVLIVDYERDLNRVQLLREPVESEDDLT